MPTPTIWLAAAVAAGVAGLVSSRNPITDSPRTHIIWVVVLALILSPAISYLDTGNQVGANFQALAMDNGVIVLLAYVVGLLAGYIADHLSEWSIFQ
jgi:hypothetical protein